MFRSIENGAIGCVVSRIIMRSPLRLVTSHGHDTRRVSSARAGLATAVIHCSFSNPPEGCGP